MRIMDHFTGIKRILHILGSYSRVLSELMIKAQGTGVFIDNNNMGGSMGENPSEQCERKKILLSGGIFEVYSGDKSEMVRNINRGAVRHLATTPDP